MRQFDVRRKTSRILLAALGTISGVIGLWALLAPMSFYTDFPGFRHGWLTYEGPANTHFIRDYGGLNLTLAVFAFGAAGLGTVTAARLTGLAALASSVPHGVYHLSHLPHYPPGERPLVAAVMLGHALLPLAIVLVPGWRRGHRKQ